MGEIAGGGAFSRFCLNPVRALCETEHEQYGLVRKVCWFKPWDRTRRGRARTLETGKAPDGVFTGPSVVDGSNRESAKWIAIKKKRPLKSWKASSRTLDPW